MSMKPGATTSPLASISRFALPAGTRPTATIWSPRIATSPWNHGLPVPSTILPLRMTRSYGHVGRQCPDPGQVTARAAGSPRSIERGEQGRRPPGRMVTSGTRFRSSITSGGQAREGRLTLMCSVGIRAGTLCVPEGKPG